MWHEGFVSVAACVCGWVQQPRFAGPTLIRSMTAAPVLFSALQTRHHAPRTPASCFCRAQCPAPHRDRLALHDRGTLRLTAPVCLPACLVACLPTCLCLPARPPALCAGLRRANVHRFMPWAPVLLAARRALSCRCRGRARMAPRSRACRLATRPTRAWWWSRSGGGSTTRSRHTPSTLPTWVSFF